MSHAAATSLLAITLAVLTGCGQMGPLYMPENDPARATPTAAPAAGTAPVASTPAGDD